jgi:hypothetical protein
LARPEEVNFANVQVIPFPEAGAVSSMFFVILKVSDPELASGDLVKEGPYPRQQQWLNLASTKFLNRMTNGFLSGIVRSLWACLLGGV